MQRMTRDLSHDFLKPYLAFDFGAESGRAVLAHLQDGVLSTREIHRFKNEPVRYGGSLHWDVPRLWYEVQKALAELEDRELAGIGVDTWGVDYALLGEKGELLQNPYHYRDQRTAGTMEKAFGKVPREEIYEATGIQFMPINTVYQLFAAVHETPGLLGAAKKLVTIPDLFHYWLTGNTVCEFTNASTTQLVDARSRTWARPLIERLGLPTHFWPEIVEPGTVIGKLLPGVARNNGLAGTPVIAPATHDTGSAVAAICAREGTAFLSSGTWSLLGTEIDEPLITPEGLRLNFTNEGGVNHTTRLLKNVMGLWMLECCRRSWAAEGQRYEHAELMELASCAEPFASLVDPDHESFLRAGDMPAAIREFCARTHQTAPESAAGFARAVIESMAFKYRVVLKQLEELTGRKVERIRVIGGGSKNRLLNQFTADATHTTVLAGPAEATALGNVGVQLLATGAASSLKQVRAIIEGSYPVEVFKPNDPGKWDREAERFQHYCEAVYA
jgi:rhamnulokinase